MDLRHLFVSFLASPQSLELRAEVHDRVQRLILESEDLGHLRDLRHVDWDDPRIAPYVDVAHKTIEKLERLSAQGARDLSVSPYTLVCRLKIDAYRRHRKRTGREVPDDRAVEFAASMAESAFHACERTELFKTLLGDVHDFVVTFRPEDRLLAYFAMPRLRGTLAYLMVRYGVVTVAELADEVGLTEGEVLEMMRDDAHVAASIAKQDRSEKASTSRAVRIRKAIKYFGEQLPYVVELCRLIRS